MTTETEAKELLSLSGLARKLDISYPRALDLLERGVLKPDFTSSCGNFFKLHRLPQLKELIQL